MAGKPTRADAKAAVVTQAVKTGAAVNSGDAAAATREAARLALAKRILDAGPST